MYGLGVGIASADELVTIPTRPGVTLNVVLVRPEGKPRAAVALFPGGGGKLGTWKNGRIERGGNFLVRTRKLFAGKGFLAAVVDVPSDRRGSGGLRGFRGTDDYRRDVGALIAYLRGVAKAPVWLVGTSRGTLAAAHAGPLLDKARGDGMVLTSSLTEESARSTETVFDAPLATIAVPVLVVHHRQDDCQVTPLYRVRDIVRRLTGAKVAESLIFDGGDPARSRACGAMSAHGFLGIEKRVVAAIAAWIGRHARP